MDDLSMRNVTLIGRNLALKMIFFSRNGIKIRTQIFTIFILRTANILHPYE